MTPSFYSLFSRSKYRQAARLIEPDEVSSSVAPQSDGAESDDQALEKRREEKERYAVAAVAFCLEYDEDFRNHFLSLMLPDGLNTKRVKSKKPEIEIEPKQSSDLILKIDRMVIVVEHKIDSDLMPHQDPWRREFKDAMNHPPGYAIQIPKQHPGSKIVYRVLSKKVFEPRQVRGIDCAAIQWEMLLSKEKPHTLHSDLYDCIGKLGVASFTLRHMKSDLKLTKQAIDAAEVYALLRAVFEDAALQPGKMSEQETAWDPDYRAFGLPILKDRSHGRGSTRASRLSNLTAPSSAQIGWIGYESKAGESPVLAVYLYCGSAPARQQVIAKLSGFASENSEGFAIRVTCSAARSPGDRRWFAKLFDALVPKTILRG
jgi:hypothetical protein